MVCVKTAPGQHVAKARINRNAILGSVPASPWRDLRADHKTPYGDASLDTGARVKDQIPPG